MEIWICEFEFENVAYHKSVPARFPLLRGARGVTIATREEHVMSCADGNHVTNEAPVDMLSDALRGFTIFFIETSMITT